MLAISLVAIAFIAADQRGWLLVRNADDFGLYHAKSARVTRVIDGDTFEIALPDALNRRDVTRIRLWGVNCPELARGDNAAEAGAQEAVDFVSTNIENSMITLWLESHQTRDPFGAVLAHVELQTGERLNEALLDAGLARCDDRWPHAALVRYTQREGAAKRTATGIWKPPIVEAKPRTANATQQVQ